MKPAAPWLMHVCQLATRQRKNKPEILGTATVACLRIWWPVRTEGAAATPFPHWAKEMAKTPTDWKSRRTSGGIALAVKGNDGKTAV